MTQRILVVEDDASIRTLLRNILERAGYETLLATTFQEGKRALAVDAPDLLIADVRLGEFNGLQLLITSDRPVPAIMITGFPDPVLAEEARSLGAAHITNPFSRAALLALVRDKLASVNEPAMFTANRRWVRKHVVGVLPARVQDSPARILDISYGGVRFEVEGSAGTEIPASFNVTLPSSDVSVHVDLVWKSRSGDRSWLCGAVVSEANQAAARAWCGVVDAIA
jgi:DNA-binding NtrC family response regulator